MILKLWAGRFSKEIDKKTNDFNSSISFDSRMYREDIEGSMAHAEMIGDCGITIQNIDGELLPEIGYHIHKKYWRKGLGSEAARAVRDWAFEKAGIKHGWIKVRAVASF